MATYFALDTLPRAREKDQKLFVSFMHILKSMYSQHVPVRIHWTSFISLSPFNQ